MSSAAALARTPTLELTPFQNRVLSTPETCDLFLGGGRGGGKSYAIAVLMLRHAEQYGAAARMPVSYTHLTLPTKRIV